MSNFPNYYPYASGQMPLNAQAYQQDQLQNLTNLCLGGTFYHKQPALDLINSMSADQLNTTTSWGLGVNAGYLPITAAIQGGDFDLVIALINRGAKIDTPDARGNTALSLGVNSHNAEINTYFGQIQADREQAARAAAQSQSTGVHSYALDPYPHLSSIYDPTNIPSALPSAAAAFVLQFTATAVLSAAANGLWQLLLECFAPGIDCSRTDTDDGQSETVRGVQEG